MARRGGTRVSTGKGNDIVFVGAPAAPMQRRRRRSGGRRRSRRTRRRSSGGGGSGSIQKRLQAGAVGGFLYAKAVEILGDKLPTFGGLGRSGTIALGVYFLKPTNKHIQDVGFAAATIAGYSYGKTGTIEGDDEF
jgi:hypothetical protein